MQNNNFYCNCKNVYPIYHSFSFRLIFFFFFILCFYVFCIDDFAVVHQVQDQLEVISPQNDKIKLLIHQVQLVPVFIVLTNDHVAQLQHHINLDHNLNLLEQVFNLFSIIIIHKHIIDIFYVFISTFRLNFTLFYYLFFFVHSSRWFFILLS